MADSFKRFNIKRSFFTALVFIAIVNVILTIGFSYIVLSNTLAEIDNTELQRKNDAILGALDYAISYESIQTKEIPTVLKPKILEIADINNQDIIIYDLKGDYLISNKQSLQVEQIKIPPNYLKKIKQKNRLDIQEYDKTYGATKTSAYTVITNNFLEPIGIVYLPYIHNSNVYQKYIGKYTYHIIFVVMIIIAIFFVVSHIISKRISKAIIRFSEKMRRVTLLENDYTPIRYYENDELGELAKAYNRMILQIQEQRERLAFNEKEKAWREMAKQVAHEVKTPLTPMRLKIQNFALRFDPNHPDIKERVNNMANSVIGQIDTISAVASAFSQFAQMPERKEETFNLVSEVKNMIHLYTDIPIHFHTNKKEILIKMDKVYLYRIVTNIISNARKASEDAQKPIINVDLEQINKRVRISVEDFGVGIPEHRFSKIFEHNFSTKNNGMGLGLTMVKKMVEGYGGEITLKSQVGVGTKFTVHLPTNL